MKLMVTVSGKDMSHFMEQWVFRNGVPRLFSSYSFVRKKNFVELKVQQEVPQRCSKFVVSESWALFFFILFFFNVALANIKVALDRIRNEMEQKKIVLFHFYFWLKGHRSIS